MENYYHELKRIHNCLDNANLPGICEFITTAFTPENEIKQIELNHRNAPYAADCLQMIGEQGLKNDMEEIPEGFTDKLAEMKQIEVSLKGPAPGVEAICDQHPLLYFNDSKVSTLALSSFFYALLRVLNLSHEVLASNIEYGDVLLRTQTALKSLGEPGRALLYDLAMKTSQKFPCCFYPINYTEIYLKGKEFYGECNDTVCFTFSCHTGLFVPLERYGYLGLSEKFAMRSDFNPSLPERNPVRARNFTLGLLNPDLRSRRHYQWSRRGTAVTLAKGYNAVELSERSKYIDCSIDLLREALQFRNLQLSEVESFNWWKSRFTRLGRNLMMVYLHGSESKRKYRAFTIDIRGL